MFLGISQRKKGALFARRSAKVVAIALLFPSLALAGPLPPGGATPATFEQTLRTLESPGPQSPAGIYALEATMGFNTLDSVNYDPATGQFSLVGHLDPRFAGPPIPYFQYLAALLDLKSARADLSFSLETPKASTDALRAKVASMPFARRNVLPYFAKAFDQQGVVTHLGASILLSLGLSPIESHRAPGFFGANVEPLPSGSVRITSLYEGSPAHLAQLRAGDEIVRFNGRPPFSPQELGRLARFAGAGKQVAITYVRDGRSVETTAQLIQAAAADPWNQATRWDVDAVLDRKGGKNDRAKVAYLLAVQAGNLGAPARGAVLAELARALGVDAGSPRAPADAAAERQTARAVLQRLDSLYGLADAPSVTAYEAAFGGTQNPANALRVALQAFAGKIPSTADRLGETALAEPAGFQVPPELFEAIYNAHVESHPEYFGESPNSQIARLMFEADYSVIKRLPHRSDLKERLPAYQTLFDYGAQHTKDFQDAVVSRVWLSVDKMDVAQSANGKTLAIRGAKMRFNRRRMTPDGRDIADDSGYVNILTALYDDLEQEYFTLHELREAAKLAAVAAWMKQKNPNVLLPKEGRVAWNGPSKVPGITYLHTPPIGGDDVLFIAHGGVNLTPFPQGNAGLPIPTDSQLPDGAALGAPPVLEGTPPASPPAAAWTEKRKINGRTVGVAGANLKLSPQELSELRDSPNDIAVATSAKSTDEQINKLVAQIRADSGNPAKQSDDMLQLSRLYALKGQWDLALSFNKSAEQNARPQDKSKLLMDQAAYQNALGNRSDAIADLQKALAIDPQDQRAKNLLAKWQTASRDQVLPAGDDLSVTTRRGPLGSTEVVPTSLAGAPPLPKGNVSSTIEDLSSIKKSDTSIDPKGSAEAARRKLDCGFATGPCDNPDLHTVRPQINPGRPPSYTPATQKLLDRIPPDVQKQPEVKALIDQHQNFDNQLNDKKVEIEKAKAAIATAPPDQAPILKANEQSLENQATKMQQDLDSTKQQLKDKLNKYSVSLTGDN